MKRFFLLVLFLWLIHPAFSQEHATCDDAIQVTTSSYGPIVSKGWADSSLYVNNNKNMYFGKAHKVVWFYFVVPYDTALTFNIVPVNSNDDFDFILFKADKGDFCNKEKERQVEPIRTNFAKATKANKGRTGLSANAKQEIVPPGYNPSYSSALQVKKGEWYYLVVDGYMSKGGFTLHLPFHFNAKQLSRKSTIDARPIKMPPPSVGTSTISKKPVATATPVKANFFIHVLDSNNHPIRAGIIIDGIAKTKAVKLDTVNYSMQLKKYETVNIHASALGHMPYQSSYATIDDTSTTTLWVRLQPIRHGANITLNIQFPENSAYLPTSSKPALDYMLLFLTRNPTIDIIIKGYVNDPNKRWSKKFNQDLSEKRANAVRSYFASHGVNRKRMQCIGYGNTRMIYPHPANEDEQAANRRVEMEIE